MVGRGAVGAVWCGVADGMDGVGGHRDDTIHGTAHVVISLLYLLAFITDACPTLACCARMIKLPLAAEQSLFISV